MKFTKSQQNNIRHHALLGRFQPTTKQFETEPKNWVKTDVPPGGTFMPARRFLGENPEFARNNIIRHRDSCNSVHTSHNTSFTNQNNYK